MAITKRGKMIYDYFKMNPNIHPTAEEVYAHVKSIDPKVGIATIYRHLSSLVEQGHLREISLEKQGVRYDLIDEEHYHFICTACGNIENIQLDGLDMYNTTVEQMTHGIVTQKNFMFQGFCKSCIKQQDEGR